MSHPLKDKFPGIMELIAGKATSKTIAFLDLWGTTSKLKQFAKSGDILDQMGITQAQASFTSALASAAKYDSKIEIIQASDGAFICADAADSVIAAIGKIFAITCIHTGKFHLIPLRASLSKGIVEIHRDDDLEKKVPNYKFLPYWGEGFLKVTYLEKKGRRGMRVFLTEEVFSDLKDDFKECVLPEPYEMEFSALGKTERVFEFNWLLDSDWNGTQLTVELVKRGKVWRAEGNEYQKEIGESIDDLIVSALTNARHRLHDDVIKSLNLNKDVASR